jgi:hypothetical protein
MSWKASAYVKSLTTHPDGTPLTAREKLILFVLADSHNEEYGYAWLSIDKAAMAALTSRRRFIELMGRIEQKGLVAIQRREGRTNLYTFPSIPVQSSHPSTQKPVRELHPTRATAIALGSAEATAPKPLESLHVTDIPAASQADLISFAIEESRKTKRPADEILAELRRAGNGS